MIDVVWVHGLGLDRRMWDGLSPGLAGVARVHAEDLPGFGDSRLPPLRTVDAMADAVRAQVDRLGGARFVLGGLSMGGYVVLAYLRRHGAERPPAGLVLFDTRAEADGPEARRGRDETAALIRAEGDLEAYALRMMPRLVSPAAAPRASMAVRSMIAAQPVESVAVASLALRDRADSTAVLGAIRVPTLVACGEDDAITPPEGMRALAAAIPGARFALVAGAGHVAPMERPGECSALVRDFLSGAS